MYMPYSAVDKYICKTFSTMLKGSYYADHSSNNSDVVQKC